MAADKLRSIMADLPANDPAKCEGLIRDLRCKIAALSDTAERNKLLNELKSVAGLGLDEELRKLLERKGLIMEALDLVVKYLTNLPEVAQYICREASERDIEDEGLKNLKRRLGPELELLGRLAEANIDVTKDWVKRLYKRAPSLKSLPRLSLGELESCCQGANEGEMKEIYRLVELAESPKEQLSAVPQDEKLLKESQEAKAADGAKLERAKELMTAAKAMATDQSESSKRNVNYKLTEILKTLELPSGWFKPETVKPEETFHQLEQIINHYSIVVESGEMYQSNVETIAKTSGGRALCGVYYSEYEPLKSAGRPLLLVPEKVILTNPSITQESKVMKFSAKGVAADYARNVESSSSSVGSSVTGFYGLFVGEAKGGYGTEQQTQADKYVKTSTTSASVLQYIRTAKKTFQLELHEMKLSLSARRMAMSISKAQNNRSLCGLLCNSVLSSRHKAAARNFMERYGSHFPAGVQTLGGIFFSIADAQSKSETEVSTLTQAASKHLQYQISVGFLGGSFGAGGSVTGTWTSGAGRSTGSGKEGEEIRFNCEVKSVGPPATNPATFAKLLTHNSTWALIDRGEVQGYVPVWELIRNSGSEFEEAADILEATWNRDERKRREAREKQNAEEKSQKEMENSQEKRKEELERAREELLDIKKENLRKRGEYLQIKVGEPMYHVKINDVSQQLRLETTNQTGNSDIRKQRKVHESNQIALELEINKPIPNKTQGKRERKLPKLYHWPTDDTMIKEGLRGKIKSFWPTNGRVIFTGPRMKRAEAYDRGITFIMQDPERTICGIIGDTHEEGLCTLRCWKLKSKPKFKIYSSCDRFSHSAAAEEVAKDYGYRLVLFFSEMLFKWRDLVPERE